MNETKKEKNIFILIFYKKIKIKMNVDELINKLQNTLNKLVNEMTEALKLLPNYQMNQLKQ